MFSVFGPLDERERLPRELVQDEKGYRSVGRSELAGALWLPALLIALTAGAAEHLSAEMMISVVAVMFGGFVLFALSGKRQGRI
jgi:hypothetical protein